MQKTIDIEKILKEVRENKFLTHRRSNDRNSIRQLIRNPVKKKKIERSEIFKMLQKTHTNLEF